MSTNAPKNTAEAAGVTVSAPAPTTGGSIGSNNGPGSRPDLPPGPKGDNLNRPNYESTLGTGYPDNAGETAIGEGSESNRLSGR